MGAENIGKQALSSFTGGIEKAIIEIEDNRPRKEDEINLPQISDNTKKIKAPAGLSKISNKIKTATSAATKAVGMVSSKAEGSLTESSLTKAVDVMKTQTSVSVKKTKKFVVKFNPSQITFQGIGGGRVEKKSLGTDGVEFEYGAMETRIQMNFQLIFDDYERTQAFMLEKFTDPEAVVRTGVEAVVTAATNRTYSVRNQVEGFIGALRNSKTRKATFHWGKMHYSGEMNYVNAEYTMFSTDGNPLRAVVNMTLLLTDSTLDFSYMGQWQDSYEDVFGTSDVSNLGNKVQNVGNLLNINL